METPQQLAREDLIASRQSIQDSRVDLNNSRQDVYESRQDIYNLRELIFSGQQEVLQRLTAIETQMAGLVGNGQPGIIQDLQDADDTVNARVDTLDLRISKWTGIGVGVWGVLSLLWIVMQAIHLWTIRTYLSTHIHYVLDEECLAGMDLFFRYAAQTGVLPQAPVLRWL
jgi:hypothetical protein